MKKKLISGMVILFVGGLIGKLIGAFYRIPLANILGADGIGIYQMMFPLFSFGFVFASGGIPFALSKFVAKARATNNQDKIPLYFFSSFFLTLIIDVLLGGFFLIFAKQIAYFQGNAGGYMGYYAISASLIFSCLLCSFRGLFQGYENMVPTFLSQTLEQIFKLGFGIFFAFVFISKGVEWGVFGALLGMAISEFFTLLFLIFYTIFKSKTKVVNLKFNVKSKKIFSKPAKKMYRFAFLLTLSALIIPLIYAFQSLMVVRLLNLSGVSEYLSKMFFGIQSGMINSIISFPTIISTTLAIILIPSISFFVAKKNWNEVNDIIKNCLKLTWIFVLPCAFGIFLLSDNILAIAFSYAIPFELKDISTTLMQISCLSIIFVSLSQVTTVILQSIQEERKALLSLITLAFTSFVGTFAFILKFNIYGYVISNVVSFALLCFMNLYFIKTKTKPNFGYKNFFVPLFSSFLMGIVVFVLDNFLFNKNLIFSTIFTVLIGGVFYFSCLIAFGYFSFADIKNFFKKKTFKKVN